MTDEALHPLLGRVLRKIGASPAETPSPAVWRELLGLVSRTYQEADQDRYTLERSIDISSREMQGLYQDLQARTESERAEKDAILRATLESTIHAILVVDVDRRVIAANKRFAEMWGLSDGVMATRDQRVLLAHAMKHVEGGDEAQQSLELVYEGDETLRDELKLLDGRIVERFSAPVHLPDGTRVGRVAFFRDVTEERLQQQRLERSRQAAESASHAKSMFLANMSHELRTPLNAVIGLADLLLIEQQPLSARQREYCAGIASSGRHLLALVNDVLDLAKIEAGKQELELEAVAVHDAVDEGMAAILSLAQARGVMLEAGTIVNVPTVRADRVRLRQILYNLVSNAVKFTDRGGTVRVRARRDGEQVAISVVDTGIGIAPEDLSRLYRAFEQLALPSGDRPPGTGLGLALTKRLVEMHGGTIDVKSEVGVGTTFTFRIPVY